MQKVLETPLVILQAYYCFPNTNEDNHASLIVLDNQAGERLCFLLFNFLRDQGKLV